MRKATQSIPDLCSEVLKSTLNSEASDQYFQVINCGTVGYGTDQELLFYKRDGRSTSILTLWSYVLRERHVG